MKATAWTH